MRRLWAYIIVVFAALVAVFASFPAIIKDTTTNGEYETRREFTFQLVEREQGEDDDVEPKKLEDNSAREIAEIMESRLVKSKVSSYDISTSGNDIITVSFSADSTSSYQQIITYLAFNGSFALVNGNDDIVAGKDFLRGKAYTKQYAVNEYPTVIIPVKTDSTDYQTVIQGAKDNPVSTESEDEEGGESVARIYLLYNWERGETYQTLTEANLLESKTLLQIDFTPDDEEDGLYYDSNKNSFSRVCGFQDANGNGTADPSEVAAAYAQADYLVNLFAASSYDFDIKCIRGLESGTEVWLKAKTEEFLDNGRLVWNRTLSAVLAAIILMSGLLAYFYKLGATSIITTTLTSAFFAILVMVKTGLEYNVLAVAGIVVIALISMVSGIIYLNKLKEDTYKGHTLKKANTEASKKSLLPIIDVHVVSLVIGVMCYVLGGSALRSFGAIVGIGSVISVIINTLGLKGLMWLLTNATALNGRYDLFQINKENVPDHMAEEKQTFYGTYTEKNFTKHKKSVSIISSIAFVCAIGGMVAAGVLRGGYLFKKPTTQTLGSEIYIQNTIIQKDDNVSPLDDISLQTILDSILLQKSSSVAIDQNEVIEDGKKPTTYVTLGDYVSNSVLFATAETKVEEGVSKTYVDTYYKLSLSTALSGNETAEIKGYPSPDTQTLNEVLDDYFGTTSTFTTSFNNKMSLKSIKTVVTEVNPKWDKIFIATSVAVGILTVYLLLRYRLSRGLASIVFPVASAAITLGIMLAVDLIFALPAYVYIAVPVIVLTAYIFM